LISAQHQSARASLWRQGILKLEKIGRRTTAWARILRRSCTHRRVRLPLRLAAGVRLERNSDRSRVARLRVPMLRVCVQQKRVIPLYWVWRVKVLM
jgi:hypothetical protein